MIPHIQSPRSRLRVSSTQPDTRIEPANALRRLGNIFCALLLLTAACRPLEAAETPRPAGSIADSVGVNIHLHYSDTVYGNFSLIESLLLDLGVKHTRDQLVDTTWQPYYQRHTELGTHGITCLFTISPSESDQVFVNYPSRVPGAFGGYEAPNEYNQSGDPNWAATLSAVVPRLYSAVRFNPATMNYPIVGPSLTQPTAYPQTAGLQYYFDFSNMHNYPGGRNPGTAGWGSNGYGSIAWNLSLATSAWGAKPVMTTETGYITDLSISQSVPESVEAKYVPRLVLEQALHGITRTYIYELIDEGKAIAGNSGAFGLARIDGSRKPAFVALKNLLAMLADPGSSSTAMPSLDFSLLNASSNVHHLLLAKSDGSYYLAFWLEELDFDQNTRQTIVVPAEALTYASSRVFGTAQLSQLQADGTVRTTNLTPASSIPLKVTDTVSILRLK